MATSREPDRPMDDSAVGLAASLFGQRPAPRAGAGGASGGLMGGLRQRLALRQRSLGWIDRARAKVKFKRSSEQLAAGTAVTTVSSAEDLAKLSFAQQADASLNTIEAWEKRMKLRRHPAVIDSLTAWWRVVLLTARSSRPEADTLRWPDYRNFYSALYEGLLEEDDEAPEDWEQEAHDEWLQEADGGLTLDKGPFIDSIFEVADMYTDSLDPHDCTSSASAPNLPPRSLLLSLPLPLPLPLPLLLPLPLPLPLAPLSLPSPSLSHAPAR